MPILVSQIISDAQETESVTLWKPLYFLYGGYPHKNEMRIDIEVKNQEENDMNDKDTNREYQEMIYQLSKDWAKRKTLYLIFNCVNNADEEYLLTNTTLIKAVQNFFILTKWYMIED